jgi:hypothetical protein
MMRNVHKVPLLVLAVSAALAACGGGGDDGVPVVPAAGGSTTTTPPPAPTASVGTATGSPVDTPAVVPPTVTTPSGPRVPAVLPAANVPLTTAPASTYTNPSETLDAWLAVQDWRSKMRSDEEGGGGVGYLTQQAALDAIAASYAASGTAPTSIPGYPTVVSVLRSTVNPNGVTPGNFCAKSMFANLPGVELATSGMRDAGIAIDGTQCALVAGLATGAAWQLPQAGTSAVYPFPGKTNLVTQYWGDFAPLGVASRPGHPIFVSVASADALPAAIAGVGTGQPIATSAITLTGFELRIRDTNVLVPATILVPAGVVRGAGVTAVDSAVFRYPTSMALVPSTGLARNTAYKATFSATVNGIPVTRTWEFTTADI